MAERKDLISKIDAWKETSKTDSFFFVQFM